MRSYAAAVPDAGHPYGQCAAESSLKQAFKRPPRGKAQKISTAKWLPDSMRYRSRVTNKGAA
jgi:hypothetical protein